MSVSRCIASSLNVEGFFFLQNVRYISRNKGKGNMGTGSFLSDVSKNKKANYKLYFCNVHTYIFWSWNVVVTY